MAFHRIERGVPLIQKKPPVDLSSALVIEKITLAAKDRLPQGGGFHSASAGVPTVSPRATVTHHASHSPPSKTHSTPKHVKAPCPQASTGAPTASSSPNPSYRTFVLPPSTAGTPSASSQPAVAHQMHVLFPSRAQTSINSQMHAVGAPGSPRPARAKLGSSTYPMPIQATGASSSAASHHSTLVMPPSTAQAPAPTKQRVVKYDIDWSTCVSFRTGGNAVIYKAQTHLGESVVIKVNKKDSLYLKHVNESERMQELARKNVSNIGPLLDHFDCSHRFDYAPRAHALVFPYQGTSLLNIVQKKARFSLENIRYVASAVLLTFRDIHALKIAHCDITPDNILVGDEDGLVRVIDWGNARLVPAKEFPGTAMKYAAPELFLECPKYDSAIDMWGLGCVLACLVTHTHFFGDKEKEPEKVFQSIVDQIGLPERDFVVRGTCSAYYFKHTQQNTITPLWTQTPFHPWEARLSKILIQQGEGAEKVGDFIHLLKGIFKYQGRITAEEALQHRFFTQIS